MRLDSIIQHRHLLIIISTEGVCHKETGLYNQHRDLLIIILTEGCLHKETGLYNPI